MATITAVAGGGNWNATGTWDTATVPTAADDVVLASTSGNVTINVSSVARSVNASTYPGTLTHNSSCTLTLGDATAGAGNAALTFSVGMTYTKVNTANSAITFSSTSATTQTITTAGKILGNVTFTGAGNWTLADDLTCATLLHQSGGTVAYTGRTVTCTTFTVTGTGSTAAMNGTTWNLTGTATSTLFLRTNVGVTSGAAATINITAASANVRDIAVGTTTTAFTISYTVSGSAGTLRFTSSASIAALNVSDTANARTVSFAASTTYSVGQFNVNGAPGLPISVVSGTAGTPATLSKTSGAIGCDYLSLKDITAAGGACWYAGANSTSVSGVTGWMFTPPSNYQFLSFF